MKPFELIPPIKDYIWGGTRLRDEYGKESGLERLAESWELSCHKDGESIVADGEYAGKTLSEFLSVHPEALGEHCTEFRDFPILVKLIDARDNLSVQVHPDNEYARKYENDNGKTEMWYIVDCDEGAELIYGFKEKITKEMFRKAIEENTLLDYVNRVPVKKGDVFFIEPGTLHAIGKGILIAEIQQSSNVTYRVYDYGRTGADGKPRELHIEKALEVTAVEPPSRKYGQPEAVKMPHAWRTPLAFCEYFSTVKYDISDYLQFSSPESFFHILVIEGEADIYCENHEDAQSEDSRIIKLKKGSSVFVPAGADPCYIKGRCTIILTNNVRRNS
ncbi:MAG: class I mannose-6-phosphate isomerase [Ruminococcus sp.]|nr:class I mannose-6-phosphate isomerase [Ruminococcus sp.]